MIEVGRIASQSRGFALHAAFTTPRIVSRQLKIPGARFDETITRAEAPTRVL
jgi:hypothetical protein